MSDREYVEFLDFTKGLYEKAIYFLDPSREDFSDFSLYSGGILLLVGLEKFAKYVLYQNHPLMILLKINGFEDILKLKNGENFNNRDTISFTKAFQCLLRIYPEIKSNANDIEYIVKQRNFLMHNFGYIQIGKFEKEIQTKVANISEAICTVCLNETPQEIFSENVWNKLSTIREAYKNANVLELNNRIKYLRRIYSQGEPLPCEELEISETSMSIIHRCPICEKNAKILIGFDVDLGYEFGESIILGASPYLEKMKCKCGFTVNDTEEIETILGDNLDSVMLDLIGAE